MCGGRPGSSGRVAAESRHRISQLRNGVRTSPSDEVVGAPADYFGVSPGHFFTIPWTGDLAGTVAETRCETAYLRSTPEGSRGLTGLQPICRSSSRTTPLHPTR